MELVTRIEEIILLAVYQLGEHAYGVTIRERVEFMLGKSLSVGAIYIPLERLAERGLLASRFGDSTPERGGRRKRYYSLSPQGLLALREIKRLQDTLWSRMPDLEGLSGDA